MSYFFDDVTPAALEAAPEGEGFSQFPIGENEAYISAVKEDISKAGNPMLEITFEGKNDEQIRWYIVDGEYKLSKLKNLLTSFGIPFGQLNPQTWIGKRGMIVVKEGEPYNGKVYNKVSHCRSLKKENLTQPNGALPKKQPEPKAGDDGFIDDIPF